MNPFRREAGDWTNFFDLLVANSLSETKRTLGREA